MNEDRFNKELEGLTASRRFVQLTPGSEVRLRLVGEWEKQVIHFLTDIVDENAPAKVALCTKESTGKCVLCDLAEKLFNSVNEEDQKIAARLVARKRYMWIAIVRDPKGDYVAVLDIGPQCFVSLGEVKRDWGDFTDEKNGYDVIIKVTTEMGWNKYKAYAYSTLVTDEHGSKIRKIVTTPLTDVEKEMIDEAGIDLSRMRTLASLEEMVEYLKIDKSLLEGKVTDYLESETSQTKPEVLQSSTQKKQFTVSGPTQDSDTKSTSELFNSPKLEDTVKKPRCFGQLYDESDEENCGRCPFKDACKKVYTFA